MGVRRCYSKKIGQYFLAKWSLHRNFRPMETGVVLYHGTPWYKVGGFTCLPIQPPPQLASWINKGLDWGSLTEVQILQRRIRDLIEKDTSLIKVIQVMLVRRVLPCQRRPLCMWEFNPEGPQTIQHFFSTTLEGMYKLFFES